MRMPWPVDFRSKVFGAEHITKGVQHPEIITESTSMPMEESHLVIM